MPSLLWSDLALLFAEEEERQDEGRGDLLLLLRCLLSSFVGSQCASCCSTFVGLFSRLPPCVALLFSLDACGFSNVSPASFWSTFVWLRKLAPFAVKYSVSSPGYPRCVSLPMSFWYTWVVMSDHDARTLCE